MRPQISMLMLLGLATWARAQVVSTTGVAVPSSVQINILHTNDIHARYTEASNNAGACSSSQEASGLCYGGYARVAAVVKQYRSVDPETLYLDAGDGYMGTIYDSLYRGNQTARFLVAAGANLTTLGNHEFDFGVSVLGDNIKAAASTYGLPYLGACNVDASKQPAMRGLLRKWVMLKVKGFRIAVLGVLTEQAAATTIRPDFKVTMTSEVEGVKKCVAELAKLGKNQKADVVVVLSHAGYDVDQTIAAQVAGIDLIIGGHTHTFLFGNGTGLGPLLNRNTSTGVSADASSGAYPTRVTGPGGKVVPITQAFYASRYMGALALTLEPRTRKLTAVDGRVLLLGGLGSSEPVMPDPKVAAMVADAGKPVDAFSREVIGSATATISYATYGVESALGSLQADAMLHYVDNTWDEAAYGPLFIAIMNSGSMRANLTQGNLTVGDAYNAQPFSNVLQVKRVTGLQIWQALENGVSRVGQGSGGRFPQLAGLRMVYDPALPSGSRVKSVKVLLPGGSEVALDACATYNLASIDYMFAGGDGYTMLTSGETIIGSSVGQEVVLMQYIIDESPLTPKLYGRIVPCGPNSTQPECATPYAPLKPCSGPVDPRPVPHSAAAGTATKAGSGGAAKASAGAVRSRAKPLMWQGKPFTGFHPAPQVLEGGEEQVQQ